MEPFWGSMAQYTKIIWGWEIAIYLFFAGLSAGALISAILVKWRSGNDLYGDGIIKAGALLAFPAISLGLLLLIVDLGKPLAFWLLMFNFNMHSVMSLGVILLSVYSMFTALFALAVFREELLGWNMTGWIVRPFLPLIDGFGRLGKWMDWLMIACAIGIAAYTGFLLSVLVAKPLMNSAALPLLFLVSGVSSGVAACIVTSLLLFKESVAQANLKHLASLDGKFVPVELVILFAMFVGMFNMGGQYAVVAGQALTVGVWAGVFWIGVIGVGLLLPLIISITLHRYERSDVLAIPEGRLLLNAGLVLTGVILLRFYILYAGQTFI